MTDGAPSKRLDAIEAKLSRAEKHFDEFKALVSQHVVDNLGIITGRVHRKEGKGPTLSFYELAVYLDPHVFGPVVGDCIHNARSALDHLAWQLVEACGYEPNDNTCFPIICKRPAPNRYHRTPDPQIPPRVSKPIRAILADIQPYALDLVGPDAFMYDPLWALNELWNYDKHRVLLAPQGRITNAYSATVDGDFNVLGHWSIKEILPDGAVLLFVPDDAEMDVHAEASVQLCFAEGLPRAGYPVGQELQFLIDHVRHSVVARLAQFL